VPGALPAQGAALHAARVPAALAVSAATLAPLGEEERALLLALLQRLA
jgi:hypothetical protein